MERKHGQERRNYVYALVTLLQEVGLSKIASTQM